MKFLSILPLASVALASISNITLYVKSDNTEVNNLGVSSIHEGAAINYLFLGTNGQELQYDSDAKNIYLMLQTASMDVPINFTVSGGIYQLSPGGSTPVEISDDGELKFDGDVYAAKNINDPYSYSERSFFLIDHETDGSIPIKLYAKFGDDDETEEEEPEQQETTSTTSSNSTLSISSYEGAAAKVTYGVAGMIAVAVGLIF
ncbi:Cell wall protein RHD3 [Candida tropicalis]